MAQTRLLQAVCTVAMLAAAPALAQNLETGTPPPNGAPNPFARQAMPNNSMAPAGNPDSTSGPTTSTGSSAATESHSMHRSATAHPMRSMHGQSPTAQNGAIDQLNEESYQAAQRGQAFSVAGASGHSGSSMTPEGSGGANGMSKGLNSGAVGSMGEPGK